MAVEIGKLFPGCPPGRAEAIARHAAQRGNGRVGLFYDWQAMCSFGIDENGFGMGGVGGSYGGASRDGYALAFVTGSMGSHDRAISVENALRTCLGLPPLVD